MYTDKYGFSDIECKIIQSQIERRAAYRKEFLKLRTDPCKHSMQAGYVFDPAIQRFLSMKNKQVEYYKTTPRNGLKTFLLVIAPMCAMGYLIWTDRTRIECERRCGKLRYRDRMFKLA